jgi:hypothetical protein
LTSLLFAESGPLTEHPDLQNRMIALLRWSNFWQKENDFRDYTPGKIVKAIAFYSATQVQICIPEIDVVMDFSVGSKGQLIADWITLMRGRSPEQMSKSAMRDWPKSSVAGINSGLGPIEDHLPPDIDFLKNKKSDQFSFQLPELTIPDCIRSKTVSKELPFLKEAVQHAMIKWLCLEGQPLPEATIPYFDLNDPWIYVVVDGKELQRGYFLFVWREGKWTLDGKEWWPDRWRRSKIISMAQHHALATVNAECHH